MSEWTKGEEGFAWLAESVDELNITEDKSIKTWLCDIRQSVEMECVNVLQSKSLYKRIFLTTFEAYTLTTEEKILKINDLWKKVTSDISVLLKKEVSNKSFMEISNKLSSDLFDLKTLCSEFYGNLTQLFKETAVDAELQSVQFSLLLNTDRQEDKDKFSKINELVQKLERIRDVFQRLVNLLLRRLVETFLKEKFSSVSDVSEKSISTAKLSAIKQDLQVLVSICISSNQICDIISLAGGIDLLLDICHDNRMESLYCEVLRALATCCSTLSCVKNFFELQGLKYLTIILTSPSTNHGMRYEAAGFLAHVTTPTLINQPIKNVIKISPDLVRALIDLCKDCRTQEEFLITITALANLSSLDKNAPDLFHKYDLDHVIMKRSLPLRFDNSLLAKSQILTILYSILTNHSVSPDLDSEVSHLLVTYIQERPTQGTTSFEEKLLEEIYRKSAVLICEMCARRPDLVACFTQLNCVSILLSMCKKPRLRNYNDDVLSECLKALVTLHGNNNLKISESPDKLHHSDDYKNNKKAAKQSDQKSETNPSPSQGTMT